MSEDEFIILLGENSWEYKIYQELKNQAFKGRFLRAILQILIARGNKLSQEEFCGVIKWLFNQKFIHFMIIDLSGNDIANIDSFENDEILDGLRIK